MAGRTFPVLRRLIAGRRRHFPGRNSGGGGTKNAGAGRSGPKWQVRVIAGEAPRIGALINFREVLFNIQLMKNLGENGCDDSVRNIYMYSTSDVYIIQSKPLY